LCESLDYLHHLPTPIIHRDISLCNLLITSINWDDTLVIVLNDFDLARETSISGIHSDRTGKPYYWAPEVATGEYSTPADIWSAGVVMYALMSMQKIQQVYEIIRNIKDDIKQAKQHEIMRAQLQVR
jgi:serine/threonine protein kinase